MDTCAVEVGLLKKHPCAHAAVAKCANCEMALCNKHAVAQLGANKQRTGKFMCAECDKALRAADKGMAAAPHHVAPKPAAAKPGAAPAAKPAAVPAAKPAAPPAAKPGAPAAAPAAKAAEKPTEPAKPHDSADDPLEFNPTKK